MDVWDVCHGMMVVLVPQTPACLPSRSRRNRGRSAPVAITPPVALSFLTTGGLLSNRVERITVATSSRGTQYAWCCVLCSTILFLSF